MLKTCVQSACIVSCTVRRGGRAHGERPRGIKHKKGKRPEKEGTGAEKEIAAQRVVHHAQLASDLSRRVVAEACGRVRGAPST